jgi:VIT1/CCC1 family predicted Fe2+/Mn2+ transporter
VNQVEKHPHIPARHHLDRIVLGGSDGAMEGVAMTSALNGAGLGFDTIVLAGLAFAIAGALSMFFSSYLSRKSELQSLKIDVQREKMEIETEPEEEEAEMVELLAKDGYSPEEVEVILGRLVKDKGLWLREMLRRELNLNVDDLDSGKYGRSVSAGVAFLILALAAVAPYALPIGRGAALGLSIGLSFVALFALGSRVFTPRNFKLVAGLESAGVGGVAAGLLYIMGLLISRI